MIANLALKFVRLDKELSIGVISPYAAQTEKVEKEIVEKVPTQ